MSFLLVAELIVQCFKERIKHVPKYAMQDICIYI